MSLRINRAEATALYWIAYDNLKRSSLEITRANDEDSLFASVTSDEVPGAVVVYEVTHDGLHTVVKKENFAEGLLKQDTDDSED